MTLSAPPATLARIVTVARAGSLTHALALFRAAGFDRADHDPAALAVAGRLAKDQALRAPAAERPMRQPMPWPRSPTPASTRRP